MQCDNMTLSPAAVDGAFSGNSKAAQLHTGSITRAACSIGPVTAAAVDVTEAAAKNLPLLFD